MAKRILTLNQISLKGLERLPRDCYEIASEFSQPDTTALPRDFPIASRSDAFDETWVFHPVSVWNYAEAPMAKRMR